MYDLRILFLTTISIVTMFYFSVADGANILVYLPTPGRSHFKPFEPLFSELGKRGHNVTVMSTFPPENQISDYTYFPIIPRPSGSIGNNSAKWREQTRLQNYIHLYNLIQNYFADLYEDLEIMNYLNAEGTTYDVIFAELYHGDSAFALASKFNASLIGLSFQPLHPIYAWLLKAPITYSYIPHLFLPYSDSMNFLQRLMNTLFGIFTISFYNLVSKNTFQHDIQNVLSTPELQIDDITRNMSLLLVESHFSTNYPQPYPPNVVEVAGIHIKPLQPLPQDIQLFLNNSKNGVIFVSLGSLIQPSLMRETGLKLLKIFEKLPYDVVWKWNTNLLSTTMPQNVFVREWLPQLEILSHENCKLFISHGGYHSIVETIYTAVPILCIPFFTDQYHNTAIVKKLQIGKEIDLKKVEEHLLANILHIIGDERYQINVKRQSDIFRDRPVDPLNLAVFWTEYVIRHKGAPHLKSAAVELYWFQLILLDVILFCLFILVSLFYILKGIIKGLGKYWCSKHEPSGKKKSQ